MKKRNRDNEDETYFKKNKKLFFKNQVFISSKKMVPDEEKKFKIFFENYYEQIKNIKNFEKPTAQDKKTILDLYQ
jgi:hypothetical protein